MHFAPAWAMDPSASYIADRENEACKMCIYIYIDGKSIFRFFRSIVLDI